jgi:hypothetical protein
MSEEPHWSDEVNGLFDAKEKRIAELEAALSTETQCREQFEEIAECTHKWLDARSVPRLFGGGVLSIIGRIMWLEEQK